MRTDPCDAAHDGHDCSVSGACPKALLAMLVRILQREEAERDQRIAESGLSGTEIRAIRPN